MSTSTYRREPPLSEETYRKLIQFGLDAHSPHITTVLVPASLAAGLSTYFHGRRYRTLMDATASKRFSRITVWEPIAEASNEDTTLPLSNSN